MPPRNTTTGGVLEAMIATRTVQPGGLFFGCANRHYFDWISRTPRSARFGAGRIPVGAAIVSGPR